MCLTVYLASDQALPTIPWNDDSPGFHVLELPPNHIIHKQLSLGNLYYLGSHEGCGCGFIKDGEVGDELTAVQENFTRLAHFITAARERGAHLQVYCCWEGDQGSPVEHHFTIDEKALLSLDFEFTEKAFYQFA